METGEADWGRRFQHCLRGELFTILRGGGSQENSQGGAEQNKGAGAVLCEGGTKFRHDVRGISNEAPRRIRGFCQEYQRNANDAL